MKISMGCDHGGYALKEALKQYLSAEGHEIADCGCYAPERCDYPDTGAAAARKVASGECERGIVICTTGIGISIAANKINGIRCAHCGDVYSAEMTRRHNDANMLALGAGMVGEFTAKKMVDVFLTTAFEGGRHAERIAKLMALEQG